MLCLKQTIKNYEDEMNINFPNLCKYDINLKINSHLFLEIH